MPVKPGAIILRGVSFLSPDSPRGHSNLRRHRISVPGTRYFLTICADKGNAGLASRLFFHECRAIAEELSRERKLHLIALTLMPDHLHAIARLGEDADLSGALRLWKGRLAPVLRKTGARWQRGAFYEHRIRADEPMEQILRYILANPYRKKLVPITANWPWWYCEPTTWEWFGPTTCDGRTHPAWLAAERPWDGKLPS